MVPSLNEGNPLPSSNHPIALGPVKGDQPKINLLPPDVDGGVGPKPHLPAEHAHGGGRKRTKRRVKKRNGTKRRVKKHKKTKHRVKKRKGTKHKRTRHK